MMVNILKLLEIFYIPNRFEVSPRRLRSFGWISQPPRRQMFSAFAMRTRTCLRKRKQALNTVATATLSVTSRHDDHDLSPKTLRPRAISGLACVPGSYKPRTCFQSIEVGFGVGVVVRQHAEVRREQQ